MTWCHIQGPIVGRWLGRGSIDAGQPRGKTATITGAVDKGRNDLVPHTKTVHRCQAAPQYNGRTDHIITSACCPQTMSRLCPPNAGEVPERAEVQSAFVTFASFGSSGTQDSMDSRNFAKLCKVRQITVSGRKVFVCTTRSFGVLSGISGHRQ
jgi:hypothetical protein